MTKHLLVFTVLMGAILYSCISCVDMNHEKRIGDTDFYLIRLEGSNEPTLCFKNSVGYKETDINGTPIVILLNDKFMIVKCGDVKTKNITSYLIVSLKKKVTEDSYKYDAVEINDIYDMKKCDNIKSYESALNRLRINESNMEFIDNKMYLFE